jgi:hypothetical protein
MDLVSGVQWNGTIFGKYEAMDLLVCNGFGERSAMEWNLVVVWMGINGKCNGIRGNGYRN